MKTEKERQTERERERERERDTKRERENERQRGTDESKIEEINEYSHIDRNYNERKLAKDPAN